MRIFATLFFGIVLAGGAGSAFGKVVDAKVYWPNPAVAETHYLYSSSLQWRFIRLDDGDWNIFALFDGCSTDYYGWLSENLFLGIPAGGRLGLGYGFRCHGNVTFGYTPVIMTVPRIFDTRQLPFRGPDAGAAVQAADLHGTPLFSGSFQHQTEVWCTTLACLEFYITTRISADTTGIAYAQEEFWAGLVPFCDEPWRRAEGVLRYRNSGEVDAEFCWKQKEE